MLDEMMIPSIDVILMMVVILFSSSTMIVVISVTMDVFIFTRLVNFDCRFGRVERLYDADRRADRRTNGHTDGRTDRHADTIANPLANIDKRLLCASIAIFTPHLPFSPFSAQNAAFTSRSIRCCIVKFFFV